MYGIAVVIGLGLHNDITMTNGTALIIHLQSGCAFLPTAAVLFDLADRIVTKGETEGINDIDIVTALILHVHRAIQTADNIAMPVVISRFRLGTVSFVQGLTHTAVTDQVKELCHTEVRRKIEVIRVFDDFLAVRVEIDGIAIYYHYGYQLLTDQGRPYLLADLFTSMVIKGDGVAPSIRRIRQDDIVLIRNNHSGDLEIRSVCFEFRTVELIRHRIVLHERR